MTKYTIEYQFKEKNGKHQFTEKWVASGEKGTRSKICEVLDIPCDRKGVPLTPSIEVLTENLGKWISEKGISTEFKRQKKMVKVYDIIAESIFTKGNDFHYLDIDRNTTILVAIA